MSRAARTGRAAGKNSRKQGPRAKTNEKGRMCPCVCVGLDLKYICLYLNFFVLGGYTVARGKIVLVVFKLCYNKGRKTTE